jgi:hypothetical protein
MIVEYKTTNIILAAFLKMKGFHVAVEKSGQQCTFIFSNVPKDLLKNFQLGNTIVEPTLFYTMVKQLSSLITTL